MRNKVAIMFAVAIIGSIVMIKSQDVNKEQGLSIKNEMQEVVEPNIGITAKNREAVGIILNILLSDESILYIKTLNYHWNVLGMNFNDLHLFFGKQYNALAEIIDEVAERARMLGIRAFGSMTEFLKNTRLREEINNIPTAKEMIRNLLDDHETIIRSLRISLEKCSSEYQDMGTSNFLTDLLERHEKMAWMLRSYLQG